MCDIWNLRGSRYKDSVLVVCDAVQFFVRFVKTNGDCWLARIPSSLYPWKISCTMKTEEAFASETFPCIPAWWNTSIISSQYRMLRCSYWSNVKHDNGRIGRLQIPHFHLKGKAVPLQAWSGPVVSRKSGFPDFMTTAQDGGKVVSLTRRPPLPLLVIISVRGWVDPRAIVRSEGFYINKKSTDTSWDRTSDLPICSTAP